MVSMRYDDKVVADFEQLVKLLPPRRRCVPAAFNGALGRLLADAGVSPHSALDQMNCSAGVLTRVFEVIRQANRGWGHALLPPAS
jgi:hypothetical protein